MSPARKTSKRAASRPAMLARLRCRLQGRGLAIAVALLAAAATVMGAYVLWDDVGARVMTGHDYYLDPRQIEITPQPRWIQNDVKQEVVAAGGLGERLWMFDEDLTRRVADQFLLHPWVAEVVRVSKHHPAGVNVELVYHRPVATVEMAGGDPPRLVDAKAVVLPSDGVSAVEVGRYPRIAGIRSTPQGPLGTVWRDAQVTGAARIAEVLLDHWPALSLRAIEPRDAGSYRLASDRVYLLITRGGKRIPWGHPPGEETLGELAAGEKIATLLDFARVYRTLDAPSPDGGVRLYRPEADPDSPRSAQRPGGGSSNLD